MIAVFKGVLPAFGQCARVRRSNADRSLCECIDCGAVNHDLIPDKTNTLIKPIRLPPSSNTAKITRFKSPHSALTLANPTPVFIPIRHSCPRRYTNPAPITIIYYTLTSGSSPHPNTNPKLLRTLLPKPLSDPRSSCLLLSDSQC